MTDLSDLTDLVEFFDSNSSDATVELGECRETAQTSLMKDPAY